MHTNVHYHVPDFEFYSLQTKDDNAYTQNEQNGSCNLETVIFSKKALTHHLSVVRIRLLKHKDLIIKHKN